MFLVGTLVENSESLQPGPDARRVPTVTIARDHKLMPIPATRITLTVLPSATAHSVTICYWLPTLWCNAAAGAR